MINNSEPSITFTDAQTAQLDEVKSRLLNFEAEISIAQKHIKTLKSDTESVVKEKIYQEQLCAEATEATKKVKDNLTELYEEIAKAEETLEKCRAETKLINDTNIVKASELVERENALEKREQEHSVKVEEVNSQSTELLKDKLFVDTAKEAFLKALEVVK